MIDDTQTGDKYIQRVSEHLLGDSTPCMLQGRWESQSSCCCLSVVVFYHTYGWFYWHFFNFKEDPLMHGWRVNRPQMGVVINIMCSPLWRGPIFTRCLPYGPPFEVYHSTINSILQRAALLNTAAEHLKHYAHHGSRVCLLNSTRLQSGMGRALLHTGHTCCSSSNTQSLVFGLRF